MDNEGPTSSVGRTFWTAWYYITGAINRFFRPETSNNFTNEPNSFQEPAVDKEFAACGHMEGEVNKKEVGEEQPLTTLTEQSSPLPFAAWELGSPEGNGQPDVSEPQSKTQLTDSQDKASIKGDEARAGELAQAAELERFHLEDGQQKGERIQSLHPDGQGEMQENGGCLDNRSVNSKEDSGAEESAARALTEGDQQRMDKASIKGNTTEGEHDTMSHGDKAELDKEDYDIHLCLRQQDEEDTEEKRLQRNTAVEFLISEKGESTVSEQPVRNQLSVFLKPSADNRLHHKNLPEVQAEQDKHSSEVEGKECYREASHTSTWVTVNSVGQEISGEVFQTILRGVCEGQQVVSQGLNPPPSEEVEKGFPESNTEQGQGEKNAQMFLEERDLEECQSVFLPEKMKDRQSMQNVCSSTASDNWLLTKCVEEEPKNKDNIQDSSNLTSGERHGDLHRTNAASLREKEPSLVESGGQEILFDAVTTGIKHLEEEGEATSKEQQGGTEELLAEMEKKDACEVSACEGDQEAQEQVVFADKPDKKQEMAEKSSRSPSLVEDLSESGWVRQEVGTEPTCLEENTAEMQDVGLNLEELGFNHDKIVSKDKSKSKNENLAVASLSGSNTARSNNSVGESEAQQSKARSSDTASKSTAKDMTVILAEGTEKHVTMIYIEETSLKSTQEVIDEGTTDPCIQTWSQDADGVRWQDEPEPGQQMGWKIEPLNREGGRISSDLTASVDQFVELSQSGGSEFRSDAGMSSCSDQSTFWDEARCESGAPKGQSQLCTLNIPGSLLGTTSDRLESDVSKRFIPGPTTESLDILMGEISEIQQSHPREAGHLSQEMVESQGGFTEESGSQSDVEITEPTGQTEKQILKEDIQSSTEMDTFVQVTKVNEDTLKDIAANSGDEVEDAGSGPPRRSSKVSTECVSQGDAESSRSLELSLMGTPQAGLSEEEDYVDALPKRNRTQATTHLTKGSRNPMEVHTSMLDCSPQKSKIAVKNPRVRPPKDPRSLLHMPSLIPSPPSHPPAKKPVGFPVGASGIGIKLPGLSGGLPVLKKTQPKELEPESKSDAPEDQGQHKPKWMPPRQPGFGNPLMSELKIKLKKTARDNEL